MRGLWIDSAGVHLRTDLPGPAARAGEVRVRVLRAGVCATDLALSRGYMGFRGVPGHEFVGIALDGSLSGRRVVGEINAACGDCDACAGGLGRHCPRRTVLGILNRPGAFAELLSLPEANLHAVPEGLTDERAVFVEPLAAAFEIAEQVDLARFERALVMGDGRLGCLCAQVLARAGLAVDLLGRHPERGAWLPDTVRHVQEPPDEASDLVVEATGDPRAFAHALARVRPRGTLVLKTTTEAPIPSVDLAPLVVDEVTIVGSRCGPFEPALEALAAGEVIVDPMIHETLSLADGVLAFEHAARPGTLKVQVEVTDA